MTELGSQPSLDEVPRKIRRNGSTYMQVLGSAATAQGTRVDTIIQNLASELSTPAQLEVLETVIAPALLKYGTE